MVYTVFIFCKCLKPETTSEFLDYFGLSSIDELPDMRDFLEEEEKEAEEDVDLYQSKYKEEN